MTKILDFNEKFNKKTVVCLGNFDCVHKGHIKLITKAISIAKKENACVCVLTFLNDINLMLKKQSGLVFSFPERVDKLQSLGVDFVIKCDFTPEFMNLSAENFLIKLYDNFNVCSFVCGYDFKFGYNKTGSLSTVSSFCVKHCINFANIDKKTFFGKKISTSLIKSLLQKGRIKTANYLLSSPYFITGKVVEGRKVGRTLNFPTANVVPSSDKIKIKEGVYKTITKIDGISYNSITNYGSRPTYNLDDFLTETYIMNFNENIYGKQIKIEFIKFIRKPKKFKNENVLKKQLKKDLEKIK